MGSPQQSRENVVQSRDITSDDSVIFSFKRYKWWFTILTYIIFLLAGQSTATLLGRLYFDKGGNSKWMATLVQSAGFPILIPFMFFFSRSTKLDAMDNSSQGMLSDVARARQGTNMLVNNSQISLDMLSNPPRARHDTYIGHSQSTHTLLLLIYFSFGLLLTADNLMYSYGLSYLPVSTYSLLCATQLAFNAIFSFILNSQKITPLILNSLVLLTISASLLAVHSDSDNTTKVSKAKYLIGFLCTVSASAAYSLYLSLLELCFNKLIKSKTFDIILKMQIYPSFFATCGCVVGLFASGEWKKLNLEMGEYQEGKVSYVMTLLWTAISWQISSVGMLGLISEVSSLFSNVISTLSLPAIPILAVIFFHDKMDGVKVMVLLLAIWGFLSYIYQHYLDDIKIKSSRSEGNEV